jgi:hypothetical protein
MNTRCKVQMGILMLGLLALAQVGAAQNKTAPEQTAATKIGPAPGGGKTPPQEGIRVHGHWTVTVRNADGSVASHHEFENSLTDWGKSVLLALLVGPLSFDGSAPAWGLKIGGPLCLQKPGTSLGDCQIPVTAQKVIPSSAQNDSWIVSGSVDGTGGNSLPTGSTAFVSKVEMNGTVKMDGAGQITSVATQVINVKTGHGDLGFVFSSRDLTQPDSTTGQTPAPINVQAGQNVDFTVDLSIL